MRQLFGFALGGNWFVELQFEPRDLWVGVYFDRRYTKTRIYICLVPCVPICVTYYPSLTAIREAR